jgi:hypothetical protein
MCSCGNDNEESVSEVDMKNNLSVQILCGQISYNSIISFENDTLYLEISGNNKYPDGLVCEVNSAEITFVYENMMKKLDYKSFPDDFIPKLLYEFFSAYGEEIVTDKSVSGKYNYTEQNIDGKNIQFRVSTDSQNEKYVIYIK